MPTSIKQADYTYEQLRIIRNALIVEMRGEYTGSVSIEVLKLVEMRLQSIIQAGLTDVSVANEVEKIVQTRNQEIKVHI